MLSIVAVTLGLLWTIGALLVIVAIACWVLAVIAQPILHRYRLEKAIRTCKKKLKESRDV